MTKQAADCRNMVVTVSWHTHTTHCLVTNVRTHCDAVRGYWTTRGLPTRGLDDSRMPPATACLSSPRLVQSASWQSASWPVTQCDSAIASIHSIIVLLVRCMQGWRCWACQPRTGHEWCWRSNGRLVTVFISAYQRYENLLFTISGRKHQTRNNKIQMSIDKTTLTV